MNRRWGYLLLLASLSAVYVATISPFKFVIPEGFSLKYVVEGFKLGSTIKDYLQNILLFIPFGISLAVISDRQSNTWKILTVVSLVSLTLSTTIEVTQFCLPARVSNLTDIFYNSLGGTLGGIIYCWRSNITRFISGVVRGDTTKLSLNSLVVVMVGYCFVVMFSIWVLLVSVNLSNWDRDFYLAVGNDVKGDRPWNGNISSLYICDRGFNLWEAQESLAQTDVLANLPSLVTSFEFFKSQNFYQDGSQHIPNLLWHSAKNKDVEAQNRQGSSSVLVNSQQWLKTKKAATSLNKRLKNSGEFSLLLTIASNDFSQTGPARIMTLAKGIYVQNIVIGQEQSDLSFRLRTPISGNSGTQPEFIIPNVFDNYSFHQILITFADRELNFYLDNIQDRYSFKFAPYISFFAYLPWNQKSWIINLEEFSTVKYQWLFYTVVLVPFSIMAIALVNLLFS